MFVLRRDFHDGPERPDLVLLHYELIPEGGGPPFLRRSLVVAPLPGAGHGVREAELWLPAVQEGKRYGVRYVYSALRHGVEWFSPAYETVVPGEENREIRVRGDGGNPLPGEPYPPFRLFLPAAEGEESRPGWYGFGAMRKKPSADLCRIPLPAGEGGAVVEVPSTLSVLKGRPMPYFLHRIREGGELSSTKIACARVSFHDPASEVVAARVLWGDAEWYAQNVSAMAVKGVDESPYACTHCFAEDPHGTLAERAEALAAAERTSRRHRTFEAFVFGPAGAQVEYCFQVTVRRKDGSFHATWRNLDGGNWTIVL
jgi:hypothetical protein